MGGSDRLGGGQIGYSRDHLECNGSERLGYTGSYQLGSRSDDHIGLGGEGHKRAGNRSIDGGGRVGKRSRLGDVAANIAVMIENRMVDGQIAAKRVGNKVDQGEECTRVSAAGPHRI